MYNRKKDNSLGCIVVLAIAFMLVSSFIVISNTTDYQVVVADKESVRNGDSNKYLIFTGLKNGETKVFENTDQWLLGKFNSSDVQGQIQVGNEYNIKTVGFRIPVFSIYENIVEFEEVEGAEE